MALPVFAFWPENVPWLALQSGYSDRPRDNKSSFEPDAGVAIERPRTTMTLEDISYTSSAMTSEQYEELLYFWRVTLKQGSLPMLRYHPRRGESSIIVMH